METRPSSFAGSRTSDCDAASQLSYLRCCVAAGDGVSLARACRPSRHACRNPDREVVARWRLGCVVESLGPSWPRRLSCSPAGRSSTSAPCRRTRARTVALVVQPPTSSACSSRASGSSASTPSVTRTTGAAQLQLHKAIEGAALGGVGPGVCPKTALAVAGLKVDVDALPRRSSKRNSSRARSTSTVPQTTLALLQAERCRRRQGLLQHGAARSARSASPAPSAIRPSTTRSRPGIGKRLDGWPNQDLNVGLIVSLAPNLTPMADESSGVDPATIDAQEGAPELGARLLRRRGQHRRQGLPSGRQVGRDPDPGRIRPSRREPPHLDGRLRQRHLLERLRREPPDARQRQLQRRAVQRPGQVPGGGARRLFPSSATSPTW